MAKEAKPAGNGYDRAQLESFIKRIDNLHSEISSTMSTAMGECKSLREDIREVYAEAKDKGVPMKALKAEIKLRQLDRDKAKVVAGLEGDDADSLEMIREALGDFASMPLGRAAMDKAASRASAAAGRA